MTEEICTTYNRPKLPLPVFMQQYKFASFLEVSRDLVASIANSHNIAIFSQLNTLIPAYVK